MANHPKFSSRGIVMGFPSKEYLVVPKPVVLFFLFLGYIKFAILMALYCLGLYDSLEPLISPLEEFEFYFLDGIEVSPLTKPTFEIKKQLKVVEFVSLAHKYQVEEDEYDDHDNGPRCVVCLGNLEAKQKVRELKNCIHAFHVECIDRWMDAGQLNCPLCRADLLPTISKDGKWGSFLHSWGRRE
ncbi:brassinosteroid-responsive RING protein 1-like [Zingiber officinale]|nr:brassinosteroid-responsive RING protein 1-like [Zingiber officinale]